MATYNLDNQADIANFHQFAAGYARDNRQYTENGTAAELLDHLLLNEREAYGHDAAAALSVPAHQVVDAQKAFLFAAGDE